MEKLIEAVGALIVSILMFIFQGYVLKTLWIWFMLPLGLPVISVANCLGIALIIRICNVNLLFEKKKEERSLIAELLTSFITWAIFLTSGYFVHLFM